MIRPKVAVQFGSNSPPRMQSSPPEFYDIFKLRDLKLNLHLPLGKGVDITYIY